MPSLKQAPNPPTEKRLAHFHRPRSSHARVSDERLQRKWAQAKVLHLVYELKNLVSILNEDVAVFCGGGFVNGQGFWSARIRFFWDWGRCVF